MSSLLKLLKTFLSSWDEWHAFLIGFSECLPPWPAKYPMPLKYANPLEKEYHYYTSGKALSFICLVVLITVVLRGC